jgi:hypothetical protein
VSDPAGYSLHCLDKDFKEIYSEYIPSHDNAIGFSRSEHSFIVIEKLKVKHIEVRDMNEPKIVKMMKVDQAIKVIQVSQ